MSEGRLRDRQNAGRPEIERRGAGGGERVIRNDSDPQAPGRGGAINIGTPESGVGFAAQPEHRGNRRGYRGHRGDRGNYGYHDYRYTHNYNYYRYCGSGYYGNPYYWADPWGHYSYARLGLFFGFHGYYPYDRHYGYYGGPSMIVLESGDPYQENVGALDLNVRPKDTEVFLNGYTIGKAGDFDGFPQLLWLEEGEYELIFHKEGYETQRRIYEVRTGLQVNVKLTMTHGVSTAPENLSHRYADPETFVPAGEDAVPTVQPTIASAPAIELDEYEGAYGAVTADGTALDIRQEPARVRLEVQPMTASLYLDGAFIGTGEQVAAVLVDAGEHVLEVVHPAYEPRELRFTVRSGEEMQVAVPQLVARTDDDALRTADTGGVAGSSD